MSLQLARFWWGYTVNWSIYGFVFQAISDVTLCSKSLACNLKDTFYMKVIAIIIPKYLVTRSLLPLCFLFCKHQNQQSKLRKVAALITKKLCKIHKPAALLLIMEDVTYNQNVSVMFFHDWEKHPWWYLKKRYINSNFLQSSLKNNSHLTRLSQVGLILH